MRMGRGLKPILEGVFILIIRFLKLMIRVSGQLLTILFLPADFQWNKFEREVIVTNFNNYKTMVIFIAVGGI